MVTYVIFLVTRYTVTGAVSTLFLSVITVRYQDAAKDLKLHPENIAKCQFPEI